MKRLKNVLWSTHSDYFISSVDDQRFWLSAAGYFERYPTLRDAPKEEIKAAYKQANGSQGYQQDVAKNYDLLTLLLKRVGAYKTPGNIIAIREQDAPGGRQYSVVNLGNDIRNIFTVDHDLCRYMQDLTELVWHVKRDNIYCAALEGTRGVLVKYRVMKSGLSQEQIHKFINKVSGSSVANDLSSAEWSRYTEPVGKYIGSTTMELLLKSYDRKTMKASNTNVPGKELNMCSCGATHNYGELHRLCDNCSEVYGHFYAYEL